MPHLHLADQPFPECERLGVRIVDAEDTHALIDPKQHDVAQRVPEPGPVGAIEIRIDDILIFLRRVLGVTDRAVGPVAEPIGMLDQPGVVRRQLNGEIECDCHAESAACLDQPAKVVERAELGMNGVMAAFLRADGIRAARVTGAGDERIVGALAMRAPDGVNRRKIDDVESQGGKLGQARDAVVEGSVPARDAGLAAWEHLVPGTGARQRRIDHQGKTRAAGQVGAGLMVGHDAAELFQWVGGVAYAICEGGRLGGLLEAAALHVIDPTMEGAADAAILDSAIG